MINNFQFKYWYLFNVYYESSLLFTKKDMTHMRKLLLVTVPARTTNKRQVMFSQVRL